MVNEYFRSWRDGWNRFWFTPRSVETLALMRILVGSMLIYTHAVWSLDLAAFMGSDAPVIPTDYRSTFPEYGQYTWSHFDFVKSEGWMWSTHFVAMAVFATFTLGLWTRLTSIFSFLLVVSYANRATGALFGLDQINAFLTLYLAMSQCGAKYSIDSYVKKVQCEQNRYSISNTIATRLIQIHLCIVYLFAGLGKLQGTTWWNGEAIWGTIASFEYQTMDLTWLSAHMWFVNLITYVAVAWEISYCCLVWHKLTRPIMLGLAVIVHLGIGFSMGMMTFGLIMIYANISFIPPTVISNWIHPRTQTPEKSGVLVS